MKKSIRLITILLAMLSAFVFISCDQASVEDLFDDGRGDNPDPGPMSGLVAPSWLESKFPSAAGAADGIIYGVTPYMEYSYGRSNIWTQCPGGKIEGLSAGNIFVRYAGTEGRLAGEAALVCMDDVSTYDGTPKLLSAEELADYNVLVVNENTGEVEIKKADTLGSYPDVYLIESAKAWNTVATDESTYNGKVLILGDNLDFSETESDEMMSYQFTGKIYGNGYLIDGFSIVANVPYHIGLIPSSGEGLYLNYVQMTNSSFSAQSGAPHSAGFLIGVIRGTTGVKVIGCSVYNGRMLKPIGSMSGGFVGRIYEGGMLTLKHSKVHNTIIELNGGTGGGLIGSASGGTAETYVSNCEVVDCWIEGIGSGLGGLFGSASNLTVEKCSVLNSIIAAKKDNVGGLLGVVGDGNSPVSFEDCHVDSCKISSPDSVNGKVAGLVGSAYSAVSIKSCTASKCEIKGELKVGGLAGYAKQATFEVCSVLSCNIYCTKETAGGGILGRGEGQNFKNCHAGSNTVPGSNIYVSVGRAIWGDEVTIFPDPDTCDNLPLLDQPLSLTFPTKEQIQDFPASKLPYVYVTYKTARGSIGAPYSDGKMTVSIPYVRSASFGSSASGNIPKPLDASTDWLMANGKVRNTDPVVSEEVVIADLLN